MGGATVKMPPSNFSQRGLASIFGINLDDDTKVNPNNDTKANQGNVAKAPSRTTHNKTTIIAGTVCGIVGLAILVLLGGYAARQWRKKHTHPEDPLYEKDVFPDAHEGVIEPVELQSNSIREHPRSPNGPP